MENTSTSKPGAREGMGLWLYKVVAGLFIVLLLGLHFIVNHLVAPGGLRTWADVVAYYQNPIIPILEILFLIFVVSHALIGDLGVQRLKASVLKELVVTDTVPLRDMQGVPVTVLSVAPVLGEAMLRIHDNQSISSLFKI